MQIVLQMRTALCLGALATIATVRQMASQLHRQMLITLQAIVPDAGAMILFQYFLPSRMNPLVFALRVLVMQLASHKIRDHG
jgi:hypothetical protein